MMLTTAALVDQLEDEGYVLDEDVLDPQRDLQPVTDDYALTLNALSRTWHAEGELSSTYTDLPFNQRFIAMIREVRQSWFQYLDISLPQKNLTADTPIHLSEAIFKLLCMPSLLDVIERLIGPEVTSNPIQHVRIKSPEHLVPVDQRRGLVAQTVWHRDQGVALPEADDTDMLTV